MPAKNPPMPAAPQAPVFALSIRQPWAWLIVNGHKDVENRDWFTNRRGPIFVHASQSRKLSEWEEAIDFVRGVEPLLAAELAGKFNEIERGGIVGTVTIADCVPESDSPWFDGDFGFVLRVAKPTPGGMRPCAGALRFFVPSFRE